MTLYSLGFVAVFGMFVLLYRHALRYKDQLELNEVEVLLTRASLRAHELLVGVGVFSTLLTWLGPGWIAPFAGMAFGLIGPVMWWHWSRVHRKLEAIKAVAAESGGTPEPASRVGQGSGPLQPGTLV